MSFASSIRKLDEEWVRKWAWTISSKQYIECGVVQNRSMNHEPMVTRQSELMKICHCMETWWQQYTLNYCVFALVLQVAMNWLDTTQQKATSRAELWTECWCGSLVEQPREDEGSFLPSEPRENHKIMHHSLETMVPSIYPSRTWSEVRECMGWCKMWNLDPSLAWESVMIFLKNQTLRNLLWALHGKRMPHEFCAQHPLA